MWEVSPYVCVLCVRMCVCVHVCVVAEWVLTVYLQLCEPPLVAIVYQLSVDQSVGVVCPQLAC